MLIDDTQQHRLPGGVVSVLLEVFLNELPGLQNASRALLLSGHFEAKRVAEVGIDVFRPFVESANMSIALSLSFAKCLLHA
jgi:hypothetical protein